MIANCMCRHATGRVICRMVVLLAVWAACIGVQVTSHIWAEQVEPRPSTATTKSEVVQAALEVDHLLSKTMRLAGEGKYQEAVELAQRTVAISEQQLGAEDPLTARSLNNLAVLYGRALGQAERALPLSERALTIFEKVSGADHPDTAVSLSVLADL